MWASSPKGFRLYENYLIDEMKIDKEQTETYEEYKVDEIKILFSATNGDRKGGNNNLGIRMCNEKYVYIDGGTFKDGQQTTYSQTYRKSEGDEEKEFSGFKYCNLAR